MDGGRNPSVFKFSNKSCFFSLSATQKSAREEGIGTLWVAEVHMYTE